MADALEKYLEPGGLRAWLDARPTAGPDSTRYRWSLWKGRPYFRIARLLWGEAMEDSHVR